MLVRLLFMFFYYLKCLSYNETNKPEHIFLLLVVTNVTPVTKLYITKTSFLTTLIPNPTPKLTQLYCIVCLQ